MLVSLLLPTRGRPDLVLRSLRSIVEHASQPKDIEVMFGIDDDDLASWQAIKAGMEKLPALAYQAIAFTPMGYQHLHHYNNMLAAKAQGQWLFIWNDDCLMETQGWDEFLRDVRNEFGLLDPKISNAAGQFERGLFPLVPKKWFALTGHLSASCQTDTYLTLVANALHLRYAAPFSIFHDRYDETGHNLDATYKARVYQTEEFYRSDLLCAQMNHDAAVISKALGKPLTHLIRRHEPTHA